VKRCISGPVYWLVSIAVAVLVGLVAFAVLQRAVPAESVTVEVTVPDATRRPNVVPPPLVSAAPVVIADSMPTRLVIPAVGTDIEVKSDAPCPADKVGAHPDFSTPMKACLSDRLASYGMPGTAAAKPVVIVGHTWKSGDAAFNRLYAWQASPPDFLVKAGDLAYLKTETSGTHWLIYRAATFGTPDKYNHGLAQDPQVWGTKPLPRWLATIGCKQIPDRPSVENIAIGWELIGTTDVVPF
jgi:hypothetical protein